VARQFKQGHDAILKGALLAATRSSIWQQREAAVVEMVARGWGHFVAIETLACTPKRGRSSTGRRVQSLNVHGLVAVHVDETTVGHSHRFCPEIVGQTEMRELVGSWACGTCVHYTELVDDVMAVELAKWVAKGQDEEVAL
jgi:hypothetical protein